MNVCDMQQGPADLVEAGLQTTYVTQKESQSVFCENESCASASKPQQQTIIASDIGAASEDRNQTERKPRSY